MLSRPVASLGLILTLVGCMGAPGLGSAGDDNGDLRELTGGTEATATDFPSTLRIVYDDSCTAAKIGKNKILTAAHCVLNSKKLAFKAGLASQTMWLTSAPNAPTKAEDGVGIPLSPDPRVGYLQVHITGAFIDPGWARTRGYDKGTDLAVIVVSDDDVAALEPIPVATVDLDPVAIGAPIVMTGYGCDSGFNNPSKTPSRLKYQRTNTIAGPSGMTVDAKRYFWTAGLATDKSSASFCPGDAGGPVFRLDAQGNKLGIVGVNASGAPQADGLTLVDIKTRVAGSWIQKVLADTPDPGLFIPIADGYGTTCPQGGGTVLGEINAKYIQLGGCTSALGKPTADEAATKDKVGRFSVFAKGVIYWQPKTGAHPVAGPALDAWRAAGLEAGALGYPTTDEVPTADSRGTSITFEKGAIYTLTGKEPHAVYGKIMDKWRSLGLESGALGFPMSDEHDVDGGRQVDFEHGKITWKTGQSDATADITGSL